jgi:hypothetical protein
MENEVLNVLIFMTVKGKGETSITQQHNKTFNKTYVGDCTTNSTTMHTQTFTETMKDVMKIISAQN